MAMNERTTAVAVFEDREAAERAIDALHRVGFTDKQIGLAAHHGEGQTREHAAGEGVLDDATKGATAGGLAGGLLGAAATGVIPGVGPVIAVGALSAILGGAAIGAGAGGLLGTLRDLGVAEEEARAYQREFESGHPIVAVTAGDRYTEATEVLREHGGRFVGTAGSTVPRGTTEGPEENPAGRATRDDEEAYPVGTTGVGPARRTDDYPPDRASHGFDPSRFDLPEQEAPPTYEQRVEEQADALAGRWATPEPADLYAHEMAEDPRFRGRPWTEVEAELRSGYAGWARERGSAGESVWDQIKDRVQDAWQRVTAAGRGTEEERPDRQRRDSDRGYGPLDIAEGDSGREPPRAGA